VAIDFDTKPPELPRPPPPTLAREILHGVEDRGIYLSIVCLMDVGVGWLIEYLPFQSMVYLCYIQNFFMNEREASK